MNQRVFSGKLSLYSKVVQHLKYSKHFRRWIDELELDYPELDISDLVFIIEHRIPKKEYYLTKVHTDSGKGISREIVDNNLVDNKVRKIIDTRLREFGLIKDKDTISIDD
jgi:hypothetical protein